MHVFCDGQQRENVDSCKENEKGHDQTGPIMLEMQTACRRSQSAENNCGKYKGLQMIGIIEKTAHNNQFAHL